MQLSIPVDEEEGEEKSEGAKAAATKKEDWIGGEEEWNAELLEGLDELK